MMFVLAASRLTNQGPILHHIYTIDMYFGYAVIAKFAICK